MSQVPPIALMGKWSYPRDFGKFSATSMAAFNSVALLFGGYEDVARLWPPFFFFFFFGMGVTR